MRTKAYPWLLAPPVGWMLLFLVVPIGVLAVRSMSIEGFAAFTNPWTWKLVAISLLVAFVTTVLCLVAGFPVAWCIAKYMPRHQHLVLFLIVLPFWINVLVRTYALMAVLRPMGLLDTWFAAVFGLWHTYLPFMILPLYLSIEKLPRGLIEAAEDLGATRWQAFIEISVPLVMPGVAAGCLLVFIPTLGSFATPELLGGAKAAMVGSQINLYFMAGRNAGAGAALTLIVAVIALVLVTLFFRHRKAEGLL